MKKFQLHFSKSTQSTILSIDGLVIGCWVNAHPGIAVMDDSLVICSFENEKPIFWFNQSLTNFDDNGMELTPGVSFDCINCENWF